MCKNYKSKKKISEWPMPKPLLGKDDLVGHDLQSCLSSSLLHLLRCIHRRINSLNTKTIYICNCTYYLLIRKKKYLVSPIQTDSNSNFCMKTNFLRKISALTLDNFISLNFCFQQMQFQFQYSDLFF